MNDELLQIPKRIKELREILEISITEMAEKLNISHDEYEKYESGEKDIPVSALYAIAAALGTDCTVLMTGESPRMDSYTIVRRGDGVRVDRYSGYYIESLAFNFKNRQMEPMLVTLEEQETEPALVMHSGQEFNLVLEGKVKVTDFGIAKVASSSTINSSSTMGSVHYISPEQARGGYSDARSDIYSLGITIFEMLTGTVPFDGDSTVAVAVQHIQDEIPAPSTVVADIPLSIDRIVIKCTQKKPDRRYQTAAELITDLKKALVMPDEDFVKMAPAYAAAGVAATASSDTEEVNAGENDDALSVSYTHLTLPTIA